ncbi:fructose 1,6-bisphosphatase II [Haemophilus influenzae 3655]|uniref:Fructose 1,6-bisphosphatase II n=1 Tax=Haemophilus influenzae (strain NTHi 3655) TaxID=375177 RepID=A0A0H3PB12_HAEI3|nr:fructose 1,6-bisphosphatase II [Haemophilus influenzae 3655]
MNRALAIEFSRVTEAAALAAYTWLGRGDKKCGRQCSGKSDALYAEFDPYGR